MGCRWWVAFGLLLSMNAFGESGFYSTRAYRIPSAVEEAGNSIVKILVIDNQTKKALGWGSGFVVEDSRTIWTAAHVFSGNLQTGMTLSLELYDVVGKKIFDTVTSSDQATVAFVGEESFNESSDNDKDFAKLSLNRALGLRPISLNSGVPALGEDLYVVGFPAIDSIQEASRSTHTQGIMQSRVTMGKHIKASEANEELATTRSPAQVEKIDKVLAEKMLFIDGDGYFGQSGAPILNERGEAVGIFTAIFRSRGSGPGIHINTKGLGPSFAGIFGR